MWSRSSEQRYAVVMTGAAAVRSDGAGQPPSYEFARLELQCRGENANDRNIENRAGQIDDVNCNATRAQSMEDVLKARGRPGRARRRG